MTEVDRYEVGAVIAAMLEVPIPPQMLARLMRRLGILPRSQESGAPAPEGRDATRAEVLVRKTAEGTI